MKKFVVTFMMISFILVATGCATCPCVHHAKCHAKYHSEHHSKHYVEHPSKPHKGLWERAQDADRWIKDNMW